MTEHVRWKKAIAAVVCCLAALETLKAESFPPAPDLEPPPILSEAVLWLDAWDYETFMRDADGFVTNWVDKSVRKNDARAYVIETWSSVLGTVGMTNGVPAYLMGEPGSGIDLAFGLISDIRSVFWVMDIVPGCATNAWFLGGGSFERHIQAVFDHRVAAFAGRFWIGDENLFSWSQRRWSCDNFVDEMTGLQIYSLSSDSDLAANRLSATSTVGTGGISGGRALSELIVFDRTLSDEEVLRVKSYLSAKWKRIPATVVDGRTTPTEVSGYGDLTLGADASFVLTDAVLGSREAAPVNVWGDLDMTSAGKIRLNYAGNVWNRGQALFFSGKGGLTLDDFELSGFPADAEFRCDGKTLSMKVGGEALPSSVVTDMTQTGPRLWLDASSPETFVTNETGGVLKWLDKGPCGNDATNYIFRGVWTYPTVVEADGVPALSLGDVGSGQDLAFPAMYDIRTVFWVMDIAKSQNAYFLGYDRGADSGDQAYKRSGNAFGYFYYEAPEQVRGGSMKTDGVVVEDTRWTPVPSGRHVYSHRVLNDVPAWASTLGRGYYPTETGGRDLSELIIFNRSLTDAERESVEKQLAGKWWMPATMLTDSLTVTAPVEYGRMTAGRRSTSNSAPTKGAFAFASSALSGSRPAVRVYGEFRREGGLAKIAVSCTDGQIAPGTYVLLECANFFNCTLADFEFTGFPENARFSFHGGELKMDVLGDVEPLVPRVLSAAGEAAPWIWLDASDTATFTTNAQGGVLGWADKGARGNDAEAYQLGAVQRYGTVGTTNGVTAYLMGRCGSDIDLRFPRTTEIRTVFWVMDIEMTDYERQKRRADFLGDDETLHFQRGRTGQYCGYAAAQRGFYEGVILEDGDIPHDKKTNPGYAKYQLKPYAPGATHIYSLQAAEDLAASRLSAELGCTTEETVGSNGGRALSELVVFNRTLTAAEFNDVQAYFDLKWHGKEVVVSEQIDATGRVSYPHLGLAGGAGFSVASRRLAAGGEAAVTVYGILARSGGDKIRIVNTDPLARKGTVLLRCAASSGISLDVFEFDGFPEGTTFEWKGGELTVADCPLPGFVLTVR